MKRIVVGIDLSLTGLGLVAVPGDWDLTWSRIATERHGIPLRRDASPRERTSRNATLAASALRFCERVNATHCWIEGYPASGRVFGLPALAELGGVVRHTLAAAGLHADRTDFIRAKSRPRKTATQRPKGHPAQGAPVAGCSPVLERG
jgi:hypothetical protein